MTTASVSYGSAREAREHFKDLLDAAVDGRPAMVTRDERRIAAVDADRLVSFLTRMRPSDVQAVADGDGWSLFLPGVPVAADGATIDEAVDEMVDALRDYAEAWVERLRLAPNHADNWGLVQIVTLASDEQLRGWLLAD
jgi:antitoxin (DNA-binding transcriptional repressor) of toxin-antitoxin stability system